MKLKQCLGRARTGSAKEGAGEMAEAARCLNPGRWDRAGSGNPGCKVKRKYLLSISLVFQAL